MTASHLGEYGYTGRKDDVFNLPYTPAHSTEATESRTEHLTWCKTRALEYVAAGDLPNAFASLMSDLRKHPETSGHAAIELGPMLMYSGNLRTAKEMREFIEGCS